MAESSAVRLEPCEEVVLLRMLNLSVNQPYPLSSKSFPLACWPFEYYLAFCCRPSFRNLTMCPGYDLVWDSGVDLG